MAYVVVLKKHQNGKPALCREFVSKEAAAAAFPGLDIMSAVEFEVHSASFPDPTVYTKPETLSSSIPQPPSELSQLRTRIEALEKRDSNSKSSDSNLSYLSQRLALLSGDVLVLKNKPTQETLKLKEELKQFKKLALTITVVQMAVGLIYLLVKGL